MKAHPPLPPPPPPQIVFWDSVAANCHNCLHS